MKDQKTGQKSDKEKIVQQDKCREALIKETIKKNEEVLKRLADT